MSSCKRKSRLFGEGGDKNQQRQDPDQGGEDRMSENRFQGRTMATQMRQPVLRHAVAPSAPAERQQCGAARPLTLAFGGETSFEALATALGFEAAKLITAHHGGRRLYLPERVSRRHPLVKLLGQPAAAALSETFGPGWIAVPLGPNATALQRRRRVQTMSEAGYTVVAIAETLGVHTRTVERHRAALKAAGLALNNELSDSSRQK